MHLQQALLTGACLALHNGLVVLSHQDGADTEEAVFIVTERAEPLVEWAAAQDDASRDAANCWGLHCVAKALSFINADCKLVHGNVCRDSVFVTKVRTTRTTLASSI